MLSTSLSFAAAHAWLRGYSDALRGVGDTTVWADYRADYERGNKAGLEKGTARVIA